MTEQQFKDYEHVIIKPGSYIGSVVRDISGTILSSHWVGWVYNVSTHNGYLVDVPEEYVAPRPSEEAAWLNAARAIERYVIIHKLPSDTEDNSQEMKTARRQAYVCLGQAGIKITEEVKERVKAIAHASVEENAMVLDSPYIPC